MNPLSAVLIGSGNVASILAPAIEHGGVVDFKAVYSPNREHCDAMAARLRHAQPVYGIDQLPHADVAIISVKDDAIVPLAATLTPSDSTLWLHTSGSVDASVLAPLGPRHGVLYPLQTFTRGVELDTKRIPLFIEATSKADLELTREIAQSVSQTVHEADSRLRMRMHIAAVFGCNFTNHLFAIADGLLRAEGLDIKVLGPLIEETLRKALANGPANSQTGPAARGDRTVIDKHAAQLPDDLRDLYLDLSERIMGAS